MRVVGKGDERGEKKEKRGEKRKMRLFGFNPKYIVFRDFLKKFRF